MLVHLKLSWNIFECSIKKITTYDNHHKSALFYDRKTIGFLSDIIINGKSFFIDGWVRFTGGSTALSNWFVAILYEPFLIGIYIKFNFIHSDRLVFFVIILLWTRIFEALEHQKKKSFFWKYFFVIPLQIIKVPQICSNKIWKCILFAGGQECSCLKCMYKNSKCHRFSDSKNERNQRHFWCYLI